MSEGRKVFLYVDRIGAHAIWGVIAPIAKLLLDCGHRVIYVRMNDGGDRGKSFIPDKVEVYDIAVPPKRHAFNVLRQHKIFSKSFAALLKTLKPDVVHSHFAVPSALVRYISARNFVPVIISTQHELNNSMSWHYRMALSLTKKYCDAVTYVSKTVAYSFGVDDSIECFVGNVQKKPGHYIIPNGVDVLLLKKMASMVQVRTAGKIVCAGRMMPVKGQQYLIEALPDIVRQYPHVHVDLIGDGPMEKNLFRQVEMLGLKSVVTFHGWLSKEQLIRHMAEADIVVVPSDGTQEGYGLVAAEALASGARLLLSDIPVFREVLAPFQESCQFFEAGNVGELQRSLIASLGSCSSNKKPREIDYEKMVRVLSSQAMAKKYLHLYDCLLKENFFRDPVL